MATSKSKPAKSAKQSKPKTAAKKSSARPSGKAPARKVAAKPAKRPAAKKPAVKQAAKQASKSAAKKTAARTTLKAKPAKAAKKVAAPARKQAAKPAARAKKVAAPARKQTPKPATGKAAKKGGEVTLAKGKVRPVPSPSAALEHIDAKTLSQIIAKLQEMRDESMSFINQNLQSDLKPREESSDVGDDLDQASTERDREFNLIMHQRHLRRLHQINDAFERMEDGTYGLCEGTDEPINPRRLLIMPLARYSLEYQEQQEKMMGRGGDSDGFFEAGEDSFSSDDG